MEIKIALCLPREAVSVPVTRQVLDSCLRALGVTPDTRGDIALALSEACANVIQHAGPGEEYEVQVIAKDRQCAIEVVNIGSRDSDRTPERASAQTSQDRRGSGEDRPDGSAFPGDPVPALAEHGRGLKIIDAVVDNLQLTTNERHGTVVHFEKRLELLPGAAGEGLLDADGVIDDRSPYRVRGAGRAAEDGLT